MQTLRSALHRLHERDVRSDAVFGDDERDVAVVGERVVRVWCDEKQIARRIERHDLKPGVENLELLRKLIRPRS